MSSGHQSFRQRPVVQLIQLPPINGEGGGGVIIGKYFYSLFTCFWVYRSFLSNKNLLQEKTRNKLGLSSAKLSWTKFGWCEVSLEVVLKQFTVKKICVHKSLGRKKILGQKEFWSEKIKAPKNWVKIGSKLGQEQLSYSWYEKKLSAQILPVQMSRWHLESKMVPGSYL